MGGLLDELRNRSAGVGPSGSREDEEVVDGEEQPPAPELWDTPLPEQDWERAKAEIYKLLGDVSRSSSLQQPCWPMWE